MNFLSRGTDFFNSKKSLVTDQFQNNSAILKENIDSIGYDAVNLGNDSGSSPVNFVQQDIGGLEGNFDNVTEQVKQKGELMTTKVNDVDLGSVPAPAIMGVSNFGFSTDDVRSVNARGNETAMVPDDVNKQAQMSKQKSEAISRFKPGLSLSEVNRNYTSGRHTQEHVEGTVKTYIPGEIGTRTEAGLSVMVNQGPIPGKSENGDRKINTIRRNSNTVRHFGNIAVPFPDEGQVIYYVTETGKPIATRRIQRSKSAYVYMAGRNPNYYLQRPGQNRIFYNSFSRPKLSETNRNITGRRDEAIAGSKRIRPMSDIQYATVDQDFKKIPTSSHRNLKSTTESLNMNQSHFKEQGGTIGDYYGGADEYKTRTGDMVTKASDLQNEFSKDQILERGKDFRSPYVDSKFGQIGAVPAGIFGYVDGNSTNPEVSEQVSQTNTFPLAGNVSKIMNTPNETIENVRNEVNTDNLKQKAFGSFNPWSGSEDKTANISPSNDTQNGLTSLPMGVDNKVSEGKEKIAAFKDKFGIFGKSKDKTSEEKGALDKSSIGVDKTDSYGVIDKFRGFGVPFKGKDESATDKTKDLRYNEDGVFVARFEDTRGPSCNYTVGAIVRLTLVIINALTIVKTITVTKNHWNWGCAPICAILMALEYSQVVFRRLGREWTWWVPCLLVYLVTTLPLIWQLQLNNMGTENGVPKKTDVWTIVASDAIVYLTIFARWLLQGGIVSFASLASVIMDFIANASDIMDLLSLTDQPEVRANSMLMYWVLGAWSVSFIKFIPLIDIDGKSKDTKQLPKYIMINFGPQFTELLQIIFTLVLLDGSFLLIRIYLLVAEGVVTFSLVFFIVKNMLSLGIQLRRLIVICKSMPCNQKQSEDGTEPVYDSA